MHKKFNGFVYFTQKIYYILILYTDECEFRDKWLYKVSYSVTGILLSRLSYASMKLISQTIFSTKFTYIQIYKNAVFINKQ